MRLCRLPADVTGRIRFITQTGWMPVTYATKWLGHAKLRLYRANYSFTVARVLGVFNSKNSREFSVIPDIISRGIHENPQQFHLQGWICSGFLGIFANNF
jgi:hypothetical protein